MDKLLIPNGGMPFTGDDLLWLQDGIRNGIADLLTAVYGSDDVVITGIKITQNGNDLEYTEGYVVIDGEILHLPAGTSTGTASAPETAYIVPDSTYDGNGTDLFADSQTKETYEIRKAKLGDSGATPPAGSINFRDIDTQRYQEVYEAPSSLLQGSWTSSGLKFIKRGNLVMMRGTVSDGDTNQTFISGIPTRFRPSETHMFVVGTTSGNGADDVLFRVLLYNDGTALIAALSGSQVTVSNDIMLTPVSYLVD